LAASAARGAFTLEPAQIVFLADMGEKTAFVEIVHTSGGPAAVQLSVYDRVLDIDGKLVSGGMAASSDFIVYPAQVILYPGERQTVQIQYRAKKKITEDRAYVLLSQEVPIDVSEDSDGSGISLKLLTDYYTLLALVTNKPGKLVFVSSKTLEGGKIEVIAENRGAGRVKMDDIGLVVGGKAVRDFTGASNSIMPGSRRRFTFEWPRAVSAKDVRFGY
jgi:P pilus assembly chaperone PapD